MHVNNKGKDVLIIGERPTQGLDDNKVRAKQIILLILHNQEKELY